MRSRPAVTRLKAMVLVAFGWWTCHAAREILMAALSTAMVGPMDGIGLLNVSRLMASCRKDGVVLKPDGTFDSHQQHLTDMLEQFGKPRLFSSDNLPTNATELQAATK